MILYHATARENLESIIEHGILTKFAGARYPNFSRRGCVYGTVTPEYTWVPYSANSQWGVIIKFHVPDDFVFHDRNFSKDCPEREIRGDVKPEWLIDYKYI